MTDAIVLELRMGRVFRLQVDKRDGVLHAEQLDDHTLLGTVLEQNIVRSADTCARIVDALLAVAEGRAEPENFGFDLAWLEIGPVTTRITPAFEDDDDWFDEIGTLALHDQLTRVLRLARDA